MDFSQLTQNSLFLTPNRRLQEYWSEQYHLDQQRQGHAVWPEPPIYSLSQWMTVLWDRLAMQSPSDWVQLSDTQTAYIFEQLIRQQETPLLNLAATAKNVIAAWNLLCGWDLNPLVQPEFENTEDLLWFRTIAQNFMTYCQQHHVIDSASAVDHLITAIQEGRLAPPNQLFYSGFSEWTPQQNRLLSALTNAGCQLIAITIPPLSSQTHRVGLANMEAEITTAARWAKQAWQSGQSAIACVIPELAHCRDKVERIFREQFSDCDHFPVNISGGTPLAQFPIIHAAFLSLKLSMPRIDLKEFGSWLRAPYLAGSETEAAIRAEIDWALQAQGEKQVTRYWLQQAFDPTLAPELARLLETTVLPLEKYTPRQWAKQFSHYLLSLGWPGQRELDSLEYQCVQRWLRLLDEFATLSQYTGAIDALTAINLCQKLAANIMFQAQSDLEPIQVVGLLEAIGHPFTALWMMGLHDEVWPASAKPNPFIPLTLQREHQLPHASADRELRYCQQITATLCQAAQEVYFSYPLKTEDRSNACSRLLLPFPEISPDDLPLAPLLSRAAYLQKVAKLAIFHDGSAPPILAGEIVSGGSAILKSMATCPFQAFARHRLGAKQPDPAAIGLSGSERGLLIHSALEFFWTKIRTQAVLLSLSAETLALELDLAILHALKPLREKSSLRLSAEFFMCEQTRLNNTLLRYLELEKQRPPFTVIGIEAPINTQLAGITFRLRADRIDQTQDGQTIIIDYKTALQQISDWFSPRPREPQLPLYAISSAEIHGLVIAQLKSHALALQGISANGLDIPGVQLLEKYSRYDACENWQDQVTAWRQTLTELASQFQQGIATVDPKDANQSCDLCDLPSLCRIDMV